MAAISISTAQRVPLISPTEVLGRRLLHDLETSEESLESLLTSLRHTANPNLSKTGLPSLDSLWKAHSAPRLTAAGRALPLLYHIISTLVSAPENGTVVVVDLDHRFSPSHLTLSPDELSHVHIFRPTRENLQVTMESVEDYMLHGAHGSQNREWRGIFINGAVPGATGGGIGSLKTKGTDVPVVQTAWKGWLRVEREEIGSFAEGMAVDEAWGERERRQEVVDQRGWRGVCDGGEFGWC